MVIKGTLTWIFRKAGLMIWADQLKFGWQYLKNYKENLRFKSSNKDLALPPAYMMFESFNMNYRKYYESGFKTADWILSQIAPFKNIHDGAVLDWGCGPARVTRHLPKICGHNANIYGTDYNQKTILWCRKHIPEVTFEINQTTPPLPFASDTFDILIGISIFTHLSAKNHEAWIHELHRVLKKDGIAFITTHGKIFRSILTAAEKEEFDASLLVIRGDVKEGHRIFTAFHPPPVISSMFEKYFTVLKHHAGGKAIWGLEQDHWILKKQ